MSQLNKAKPAVEVTLGGKKRKLVFNLWAKAAIQEDKGRDFLPSIDYKNPNILELAVLLWASLLDSSPELEGGTASERRKAQKQVVKWLEDLTDYKEVVEKLFEAMLNSIPEQDKDNQEGDEDDKKKSQQTDTQSSPS